MKTIKFDDPNPRAIRARYPSCDHEHPQPWSNRRRQPAGRARGRAGARRRPGRGRPGTRHYRNGPARVCVELGVARDAVDPLDERSRSAGRQCPPVSWQLAGAGLLAFAPSGSVIDALGWIWPPVLLVLLGGTVVRVRKNLPGRTRFLVVYPLLAGYALVCGRRRLSDHPSVDRPAPLQRRQGN